MLVFSTALLVTFFQADYLRVRTKRIGDPTKRFYQKVDCKVREIERLIKVIENTMSVTDSTANSTRDRAYQLNNTADNLWNLIKHPPQDVSTTYCQQRMVCVSKARDCLKQEGERLKVNLLESNESLKAKAKLNNENKRASMASANPVSDSTNSERPGVKISEPAIPDQSSTPKEVQVIDLTLDSDGETINAEGTKPNPKAMCLRHDLDEVLTKAALEVRDHDLWYDPEMDINEAVLP